jgi:multiple antibiotic resistance protein
MVGKYVQGIFMILSLVNPVICGAMFLNITAGKPTKQKIADATRIMLSVGVILCLAAVGGAQLLKTFGISLDAFQAAGGTVLAWMGFLMLRGTSSPTADQKHQSADSSITPLILFAASPGTITGVITLSVSQTGTELPITAIVSVVATLTITWGVMIILAGSARQRKPGLMKDVTARFMGLIVLAMGVQFMLTGLKAFFAG